MPIIGIAKEKKEKGSDPFSSFSYRVTAINDPVYDAVLNYDASGNITYQTRGIGDLDTGYDALDKLTDATGSLGARGYQYDRNGNRTALNDGSTVTHYGYEPLSNRMNYAGSDNVTLDANGNTTLLRGMNLSYSPDNRLISVTHQADTTRYAYNAQGGRVIKLDAQNSKTLYVYGAKGQLLAEMDGAGNTRKVYVYSNGQPVAMVDYSTNNSGDLYYIHNDHLGTPQALTDESGSVVWRALYQPFGEAIVDEDPDLDTNKVTFNLRFPGQYYDQESGLHYNYFRDYDPSTGRYIQSDPIGLQGGLNSYAYVENNPLIFVDPFGLFRDCRFVDGGSGFADYYVCDNGGPDYNSGDASAFPESTNNQCTLDCIRENSDYMITVACGSLDVAVSFLSRSNTAGAAAGGTCLVALTTMSCTLDCDDDDCE